jgi:spore coat protein U-like protein
MRISTIVLLLCLSSLIWSVNRAEAFKCDVTATGLNFGSYDVFSPVSLDSTASINVSCNIPAQNPQAPLAVTISLSPGSSGSFAPRAMQSAGGDTLFYELSANASLLPIWGDGSGSSTVQTAFVTSEMPWNATLFGRIPARQNVRASSYSDTITVTIDF